MYKLKPFIWSSHKIIAGKLNKLKPQAVLDIGCADGFLGQQLTFGVKNMVGVDIKKAKLPSVYTKFWQLDLEESDLPFKDKFDCIVLADVLEHLQDPKNSLVKFKKVLKKDGFMIISVPNMDYWLVQLLSFFHLRPKSERGFFDRTHRHDFNQHSLQKLLTVNSLTIKQTQFTPIPLPALNGIFDIGRPLYLIYKFQYFLATVWPRFFAYQIIVEAKLR